MTGHIRTARTRVRSPLKAPPVKVDAMQTEQQWVDKCDVNSIMRRYQKTGAIEHVNKHRGQYGTFDPDEYYQAQHTVARVKTEFAELPSSIRHHFRNDPAEYLRYIAEGGDVGRLIAPDGTLTPSEGEIVQQTGSQAVSEDVGAKSTAKVPPEVTEGGGAIDTT